MSLTTENFTSRWTTPTSTVVTSTGGPVSNYLVTTLIFPISNGTEFPGTVLAIQRLSYLDAGQYICEGRVNGMTEWVSAVVQLILNSKRCLVLAIMYVQFTDPNQTLSYYVN